MGVKKINFSLLKDLLPNISELVLRVNETSTTHNDLPPILEVWEVWPRLEQKSENYIIVSINAWIFLTL